MASGLYSVSQELIACEAVQAFGASKDLQYLQAVFSLALSGGVLAAALGAGGILLWDGGWHTQGGLKKWEVIGEGG